MDKVTDPLQKAVEIVGGQVALAKKLGPPITQAHVWKWLHGSKFPPEQAIPVEEATNGRVTRYELRPDVFGQPPKPTKKNCAA